MLTNGRIVAGTGAPWFRGDIGIHGQRIVALGDLSALRRARGIDVLGHIIAPGFTLTGRSTDTLVDAATGLLLTGMGASPATRR